MFCPAREIEKPSFPSVSCADGVTRAKSAIDLDTVGNVVMSRSEIEVSEPVLLLLKIPLFCAVITISSSALADSARVVLIRLDSPKERLNPLFVNS